ncbi:MAG TPA: cellulase family glycosylhydrolase, partial [Magnetospirillaceae bacterium]|nr:cellulase family glycosylhydrolase [Magnetospirillaceae bacterium]
MLEIRDGRFLDVEGRTLLLRGVNLGGSSKFPSRPDGRSHLRDGFYEGRNVSFVGRPFPLEEAGEHLDRLKLWGLDFLRLLVPWEAVEHAGPGLYDEEYLDYLERVTAKAAERGIRIFIDPHQDCWSRWTGGDGAPAWTLEEAGFELRNLHASGAAFLHQEHGDPYPRMVWAANYNRLACATMFTLFFGGDQAAPGLSIEGEPIQERLQGHYIRAMARVAGRLGRFQNVVGFDSMNEPSAGFLGLADLSRLERALTRTGPMPTPWEAMQAGHGHAVQVDRYGITLRGQAVVGRTVLGRQGTRAWRAGTECLWRRAGIWEEVCGKPALLRPDAFSRTKDGRRLEFGEHCIKPFARRYIHEVRAAAQEGRRLILFLEGAPTTEPPSWSPQDDASAVNAEHWYDALTLTVKRWFGFLGYDGEDGKIILGRKALRRYFRKALERVVRRGREKMGGIPSILGEFGLPFDLDGGRAYRTGDFRVHERALAAYHDALDSALLSSTIWNYTADNTNERGDGWNGEDLSIYSRDQSGLPLPAGADPREAGGRGIRGFCRPWPRAVAGEPVSFRFDARGGSLEFRYRPDQGVSAPTEIFLPPIHYPGGCVAESEGGTSEVDLAGRVLRVWAYP